MVNKVLYFLYLVTSNVNGFSIDQVIGHTGASKSNESDIDIHETLEEQQKDQTVEKYDGNRSHGEDPIYQDIDEKSYHEMANQKNNQNKHSDDKFQNYASINLTFPKPYQTLRSSLPQNQAKEPESDNKTNCDYYASLAKTKERSYGHLPKTDSQSDTIISFQLKPETAYEESGSTSPLYKALETFNFDGVES